MKPTSATASAASACTSSRVYSLCSTHPPLGPSVQKPPPRAFVAVYSRHALVRAAAPL